MTGTKGKELATLPHNGPGQVSALTGTSLTYGSYMGPTFTFIQCEKAYGVFQSSLIFQRTVIVHSFYEAEFRDKLSFIDQNLSQNNRLFRPCNSINTTSVSKPTHFDFSIQALYYQVYDKTNQVSCSQESIINSRYIPFASCINVLYLKKRISSQGFHCNVMHLLKRRRMTGLVSQNS